MECKKNDIMNNYIKKSLIFLSLILAVVLTSCRSEDDLSIDPPAEANIEENSTIALLMKRVATNDGSEDNIVDGASNLTVQLPVEVTVNGLVLNISNEGDYDEILDAIDASDNDDDIVEISYPITVVLSDYSTVEVNSDSELDDLTVTTDNDDDIECIDFDYPIMASVFNEITETFEIITINNDNQMYDFIEGLNELAAVSIVFPITVILADGSEQLVDSIQELEEAIILAENTCDEDDDNDFDECNTNTYTPTFFEDSILTCDTWTIDKLKRNNNSLQDLYEDYTFAFNADGTLLVTENANIFNGTWVATGSVGDVDVTINVIGLPDFNDTWNLCLINLEPTEKKIELKLGTDRLRFGSDCEGDGNIDDSVLVSALTTDLWYITYFFNESDQTVSFADYQFNFSSDNIATAADINVTTNGTWSTSSVNPTILELILNFGPNAPLDDLDEDWEVLEVTNDLIGLKLDNNFLTFGRTPYEGGVEDSILENALTTGDWYITYLFDNQNVTSDLMDYVFNFSTDNFAMATDTNGSADGNWSVTTGDEVSTALSLNFGSSNPLNDVSATWDVFEVTNDVLRLKGISNGNGSENWLTFKRTPFDGSTGNEELIAVLSDGLWVVDSFTENEIDETANYVEFEINFDMDETVLASNGSDINDGSWEVFSSGNQIDLNFGNDQPFRDLNDNDWDVISVTNTEVIIQDVSIMNSIVITHILTLQKL